ncbi:MAG: general secretion pathway protein GspB [Vitreoscilla sp.]|nr:general secretion pathway protein GspB [Vitreoscilla sp.]
MSFILDALRRADAERERGQLPDLHARSLSARATPEAHVEDTPWLRIAAVATALLLAGLLAWLLLRAEAPPSPQTPAPPEMPAPRPEVAVSPPVAPATPAPAPVARAEVPGPRVAPPPLARTAPAKAAAPMASSVAPTTTATTATTAATPTPAPRPAQPPAATVPALKVGGVMYAETPENRVLVINDQVLREGETVQPGLVLEHIGPKSARLRWKDQVVEVPY